MKINAKRIQCITIYAALLSMISGCTDHEKSKASLIGNWEANIAPGRYACIEYLEGGRFYLFNREEVPANQKNNSYEHQEKTTIESENRSDNIETFTNFSIGHWELTRGLRYWQRGALVVDGLGNEIPRNKRVLSKPRWYVLKFIDNEQFVAIQREDRKNRLNFSRVESCANYGVVSELGLIEPPWE